MPPISSSSWNGNRKGRKTAGGTPKVPSDKQNDGLMNPHINENLDVAFVRN